MSSNGLENFVNVITALAAFGGVTAAWFGLFTWKSQVIWAADNDLARRLLNCTYRYRDSLYAVRYPIINDSEMEIGPSSTLDSSPAQAHHSGVIQAYERRWERHYFVRAERDALLFESDLVWGNNLSKLFEPLRSLEQELRSYIRLYLNAHCRGETEIALYFRENLKKERDILHDQFNEGDVFRPDFVKGLTPVENYLRVKLGRLP